MAKQGHAQRRLALTVAMLIGLLAGGIGGARPAAGSASVTRIVIGQPISTSPMVLDARTGHLFVATAPMTDPRLPSWVTMIDVRSGSVLRRNVVGQGQPVLAFDPAFDRVYVAGLLQLPTVPPMGTRTFPPRITSRVLAVDGATGRVLLTARVSSEVGSIIEDDRLHRLFVTGGGGGGCMNQKCYTNPAVTVSLDARTLKTLTTIQGVGGDPVVDARNGRIYVQDGTGLDVLDARSGKRLLRLPLPTTVLAVDEPANRVYLAARGDTLLLDGSTSQVLAILRRPVETGDPLGETMAVDPRSGGVYFAAAQRIDRRGAPSGPVRLYEADGATGQVLRSCPIAAHPTAIALAPRSGRVIVTDYGQSTATIVAMAGCRVIRRAAVAPDPVAIAVDEVDGRVVIESNNVPPQGPPGAPPVDPTGTTLSIIALPR